MAINEQDNVCNIVKLSNKATYFVIWAREKGENKYEKSDISFIGIRQFLGVVPLGYLKYIFNSYLYYSCSLPGK